MKKGDQIFIFSKWRQSVYPENDEKFCLALFKDWMVKKGYLVKNIRKRKVILVDGVMAWARKKGIDYKKRWQIQNQIDKMKEPTEYKLFKKSAKLKI